MPVVSTASKASKCHFGYACIVPVRREIVSEMHVISVTEEALVLDNSKHCLT